MNGLIQNIVAPEVWSKSDLAVITPATDFKSFPGTGAQKVKCWMQILHGVLVSWLRFEHFTNKWGAWLEKRCSGKDQAVAAMLDAVADQARFNALIYAEQTSSDWPAVEETIQIAADKRKASVNKIWGGIDVAKEIEEHLAPAALSTIDLQVNQHGPDHAHTDATDYGANINTSGARFETYHGSARAFLKASNGKFPEVFMMVKSQLTATFYNAATNPDGRFPWLAEGVHKWMCTDPIFNRMLKHGIVTPNTYAEDAEDEPAFEHVVGYGKVIDTLADGEVEVAHFELCDREPFARRVRKGCWYHISLDGSTVVRVLKCVRSDTNSMLQVQWYTVSEENVHVHYPVLTKRKDPQSIDVGSVVRPAHVWHKCTSQCETVSFTQCRKSTGQFVLNPFYLK